MWIFFVVWFFKIQEILFSWDYLEVMFYIIEVVIRKMQGVFIGFRNFE